MSRIVVAGPYPTMTGPEAQATFSFVRRLVAEGKDVTVISPWPSAAHHHADPIAKRGSIKLAKLVRDADVLHLRLDAAALHADADDRSLFPVRMALRVAMQRPGRCEVRLDRVPRTVSRQWATLVLGRAALVLVTTEDERQSLTAAGVPASKIVVDPEPETLAAACGPPPRRSEATRAVAAPSQAAVSAAELQALVRSRAAEDRLVNRKPSPTDHELPSLPLRHLARMGRAPVRSSKPGGTFLKRLLIKSLAWQFDNVIASVNRLHQATIDAFENLEAQLAARSEDGRPVR